MNELNRKMRDDLRRITSLEGFGMIVILQQPGDVPFAESICPRARGHQICADGTGGYDIWVEGRPTTTGLTLEAISDWLKARTPEWLYDDSEVTPTQQALAARWLRKLMDDYGMERGDIQRGQ